MFRYNYYSPGVRLLNLLAGNQLLFQSKTAILQAVVMYIRRDARVRLTPPLRRGGSGGRTTYAAKGKAHGGDLWAQPHLSDRDTGTVVIGEYGYQMTRFSEREEIRNL